MVILCGAAVCPGVQLDAQMPFPSHYYEYLDYTQPELISLLFTDLGVFAPRNVSEELAKLYESC